MDTCQETPNRHLAVCFMLPMNTLLTMQTVITRVSTTRDEKHLACLSLVAQGLSLSAPITQEDIKVLTSTDPETKLAIQLADKLRITQAAQGERAQQTQKITVYDPASAEAQLPKEGGPSYQIAVGDKAQKPSVADKDFNICTLEQYYAHLLYLLFLVDVLGATNASDDDIRYMCKYGGKWPLLCTNRAVSNLIKDADIRRADTAKKEYLKQLFQLLLNDAEHDFSAKVKADVKEVTDKCKHCQLLCRCADFLDLISDPNMQTDNLSLLKLFHYRWQYKRDYLLSGGKSKLDEKFGSKALAKPPCKHSSFNTNYFTFLAEEMLNDPFMRNMENTINIIGRLISIQITKEEERNEILNSASKMSIEAGSATDLSSQSNNTISFFG